jgi:hypothetical protein
MPPKLRHDPTQVAWVPGILANKGSTLWKGYLSVIQCWKAVKAHDAKQTMEGNRVADASLLLVVIAIARLAEEVYEEPEGSDVAFG